MSIALGNVMDLQGEVDQGLTVLGKPKLLSDLSRRSLGVAVGGFPEVLWKVFAVFGVPGHAMLFVDPFARFLDGLKNVLTKPLRRFHRSITSHPAGFCWSLTCSELERLEERVLEVKG